jgi:hypothetical protein
MFLIILQIRRGRHGLQYTLPLRTGGNFVVVGLCLCLLRLPTTTVDRIRGRGVSARHFSVEEFVLYSAFLLLTSTVGEFLDVLAIFKPEYMYRFRSVLNHVWITHHSSSRQSL